MTIGSGHQQVGSPRTVARDRPASRNRDRRASLSVCATPREHCNQTGCSPAPRGVDGRIGAGAAATNVIVLTGRLDAGRAPRAAIPETRVKVTPGGPGGPTRDLARALRRFVVAHERLAMLG